MYSSDLYSQNKIEVRIQSREKIKSIRIEAVNFSKRISVELSSEVFLEIPDYGEYTILVEDEKGLLKKKQIQVQPGNTSFSIDSEKNQDGIVVLGEKDGPDFVRLKPEEINKMPGTFGDSLKAIFNIPGIAPIFQNYNSSGFQSAMAIGLSRTAPNDKSPDIPNSQRGFLVMRGAGTRANQFYYDGLPLVYPFHADGITSVLNNNTIRSLEVYSGTYSARYGFATGGVIAVEGFKKKNDSVVLNLNTFLVDGYVFKNITKNLNVSVSGRKYYPNYILGRIPDLVPNQTFVSDYSDYQFRINWEIDNHNSLTVSSFGTKDYRHPFSTNKQYEPKKNTMETLNDSLIVDRNFRTDGIQYIWKPFEYVSNTMNISRSYFQERIQNSTYFTDTSKGVLSAAFNGLQKANTLGNDFSEDLRYFEDVMEFNLFKKILKLKAGGQYRETVSSFKGKVIYINENPEMLKITQFILSDPNTNAVMEGDRMVRRQLGYFSEMKLDYKGNVLSLGARRDYYDLSREWKTSPRLMFAKEIDFTKTTFFGGTGKFFQAPPDVSYISKKIGNPNLKMEESQHSNIGIEQKFLSSYSIKLEGYKNTFDNLAVRDNLIYNSSAANINNMVSYMNNQNTELVLQRNVNYSNSMSGWSKGFELMIKKEIPEDSGFFGWISYTNSLTKRNRNQPNLKDSELQAHNELVANHRILYQDVSKDYYTNVYDNGSIEVLKKNSKEEYYDLDRTHMFSFVGGWKYKDQWQIGTRIIHLTNYAYTPIVGSELTPVNSLNIYTPTYSNDIRSARLPSYNQIDIRFDRFITTSWAKLDLYFKIINLTGNRIAVSKTLYSKLAPYIPDVNPSTSYINQNGLEVGKTKVPMFNFGIQMQF
ncbi:TonB-dependent receptor plug domain-containing protein [Leptospira interrogans]|uniref:TonB-dependent receptor plug domain-containing protein n=1 Tax=Leptospira interrogans TaxID=173 RepID=UPI0018A22C74|nr:TonB-dependent receptor plug domain-containing protein [Leptospira interrogans]